MKQNKQQKTKKNSFIAKVKLKAKKIAKKTKKGKKLYKLTITHRNGQKTSYLVNQVTAKSCTLKHKAEIRFNIHTDKKGEIVAGKYVKRRLSHISKLKLKKYKP